ncbi:alkaline phosphatase PhoX [Dactylosporangium sp. NPDC000244]|uniref:alkaline phosphatase PhoX n=1 Tax=Dactylosporangium sp. NPDC000244 TaxID=3154365 RepID=UPI00332A6E5B
MTISRRQVLSGTAAAGVGLTVAGALPTLAEPAAAHNGGNDGGRPNGNGRAFPPLQDDPKGILALPAGFSYAIVTREGETDMSFGQGKTPAYHDGTGVVGADRNGLTIIQNHEMTPYMSAYGVPHIEGTVYDPGAKNASGCTVITTDRSGRKRAEWVGISGTVRNCAGGVTPWGTWLTCEETFINAGATWSAAGQTGTYEKDHGYVFEVLTSDSKHQLPKPIKAFGRFEHEALAVEPNLKHVYLSEDASGPNGLFYRWTAPRGARLHAGLANTLADDAGKLEAMQIRLDDGSILPDVAFLTSAQLGRPFKVSWVEVPDRDARTKTVRTQFADGQVTRGKKFEGVWSTNKGCYIVNSFAFGANDLPAGATKHDGMVWFYDYSDETITLVTYFPHNPESEGEGPNPKYADMVFDGPDNVTVTPWGSLVLAEDGVKASHVLSSIPGGPTYAIARNMLSNGTSSGSPTYSEFTGPTFSPDGKILFVNIQAPGITLAITGPWEKYLG